MRILLMANGPVGLEVTNYLRRRGENIVGLVVHAPDRQRQADEIIAASGVHPDDVMQGPQLRSAAGLAAVRRLKPDVAIAAFWAYILKPEFLDLFPKGCVNFHPGLLPFNRGKNPNVWPFIEGTPAGVTLHYVDADVDTGDIIAQQEVPIEPTDTGGTLYDKTLTAMVELFKRTWPALKDGTAPRIRQDSQPATFHLGRQVDELDRIDLKETFTAGDLLNLLRARTYGDRAFAYFSEAGQEFEVGVFLKKRVPKGKHAAA